LSLPLLLVFPVLSDAEIFLRNFFPFVEAKVDWPDQTFDQSRMAPLCHGPDGRLADVHLQSMLQNYTSQTREY
jgi:hypothetical protein